MGSFIANVLLSVKNEVGGPNSVLFLARLELGLSYGT